ncbi:MAG TPA: aliphatic sulfonate ABC transporter substrate-binding protein [Afipia sp.]
MKKLTRRAFASLAAASMFVPLRGRASQTKTVRFGYQKTGIPVIARRLGTLEKRLEPLGVNVTWTEFPAALQTLEALNAKSIDIGHTGDMGPIFGQATGIDLVYIGAQPWSGTNDAILVGKNSGITSVKDLKGKKVAFARGTTSHNFIVTALEKSGLSVTDVVPVYLNPSDGSAALGNGSVDAWVVWDPYFAIAELRNTDVHALASSRDYLRTFSFFLANRAFAELNPAVIESILAAFRDTAAWATSHRDDVAQTMSDVTGVDLAAQKLASGRSDYNVVPMTDDVVATQQERADRFFRLNLIPRKIVVRDAVWKSS